MSGIEAVKRRLSFVLLKKVGQRLNSRVLALSAPTVNTEEIVQLFTMSLDVIVAQ